MEQVPTQKSEEKDEEKQSDVQAEFKKEEIFIDPECFNDDIEEVFINN